MAFKGMSNKEKELLLEIGESRAALKALRDLGFALADPKQKFDGPIIGQALNVVPVRILYPGDNDGVHDEGDVIGRPKDYTAYPIDQAKIIHIDKPRWMERFAAEAKLLEKGYYAAEYSSKAKGKPITYKRLELDIREQPEKAHLTFERDEGELPERLPDEEVTERPPVRFPFRKEPPLLPPHVEPPPELDLTSPKRGEPEQIPLPFGFEKEKEPEEPPTPRKPRRIALRINSTPEQGVYVNVDGRGQRTNCSVRIDRNSVHQISIDPEPTLPGGRIFHFVRWSDGNPNPARAVQIADRDVEITAFYQQEKKEEEEQKIKLTIESYPSPQVPIEIFKMGAAESLEENSLKARFVRGGPQIWVIVQDFRARNNAKRFADREAAKKWLNDQLFTVTQHPEGLSEFILEHEFDKQKSKVVTGEDIEGSERWRPRGSNLVPIGENFKTTLFIDLPATKPVGDRLEPLYLVSVPESLTTPFYHGESAGGDYTFVEWQIFRRSAGTRNPIIIKKPQAQIVLDEPVRMVAYYYKSATHNQATTARSAYQGGTNPTGEKADKDTFLAKMLGSSGVRGRIGRDVAVREIKTDPYMSAAINKGKRILNGYAKAEYTRIFNPLRAEFQRRGNELRVQQRRAAQARAALRRIIRQNMRAAGARSMLMRTNEDTINIADQLAAPGAALAGNVALIEERDRLREYLDARDAYYKDFEKRLESASAQLKDYMRNKGAIVATGLARRYKMPLNSSDQAALTSALQTYGEDVAEDFAVRGRTIGHAFMRGLGIMRGGVETGGAVAGNLLYNTFDFIFGPWTIMSVFALIEFFFILTYIGYNLQFLWIMPMIGAAFTFLLNFSDTFKPLDWITHIASGAVIGYSALFLLLALGAQSWTFIGGVGFAFWIIWAIIGFIGIFQFYQNGGYKIILQAGVVILIFAYVALGPYQAYYWQVVDQAKAPVEIAYRAISTAVSDVWLLATNPTEWYARQQLVNVQPEHPLDFPKGIEVTGLEALPPAVPGGQGFALTAVIKNEGYIDAKDIMVAYSCNQWCISRNASVINPFAVSAIPPDAQARLTQYGLLGKVSSGSIYYMKDDMDRGVSDMITIKDFVARISPAGAAETNFARVYLNISYASSTNSSLQVSVIADSELQRRFTTGDIVFKPVTAVSKSTPAQLSLNVGPQPLKAGTKAVLLVSVSNTRDDSKIILYKGAQIIIRMPKLIGSGLKCDAFTADDRGDYWELTYKISQNVEVLPYESRSILAFLCEFDTNSTVGTIKTGLVTAELPSYIFTMQQQKDIPLTPKLGIIFDPFEQTCNKCGGAASCSKQTCESIKDGNNTCWFVYGSSADESMTIAAASLLENSCHSCHLPELRSCDMFKFPTACNSEATQCGLHCEWKTDYTDPRTGLKGPACIETTTTAVTPPAGCSVVPVALDTIRAVESSGGNYHAQNTVSTASGAYQFIDLTWQDLTAKATSCNAQQYARAVDAPAATQDCIATYRVNDILGKNNNDVTKVPVGWYWPTALTDPSQMSYTPPGNTKTVAKYQEDWMAIYNQKMSACAPSAMYPGSVLAINYIDPNVYNNNILAKAPPRTGAASPTYIVLHHSGGDSIGGVLSANSQPNANGDYTNEHYIVGKNGEVVSVIPETLSAQHANCMNSRSVGIEIVNLGDGSDPYPDAQVQALRNLVSYLISKYNIQSGHLIGHGCTNPLHKDASEPTGLDPNFLQGWTIMEGPGSGSSSVCSVPFCTPSNPATVNPSATI